MPLSQLESVSVESQQLPGREISFTDAVNSINSIGQSGSESFGIRFESLLEGIKVPNPIAKEIALSNATGSRAAGPAPGLPDSTLDSTVSVFCRGSISAAHESASAEWALLAPGAGLFAVGSHEAVAPSRDSEPHHTRKGVRATVDSKITEIKKNVCCGASESAILWVPSPQFTPEAKESALPVEPAVQAASGGQAQSPKSAFPEGLCSADPVRTCTALEDLSLPSTAFNLTGQPEAALSSNSSTPQPAGQASRGTTLSASAIPAQEKSPSLDQLDPADQNPEDAVRTVDPLHVNVSSAQETTSIDVHSRPPRDAHANHVPEFGEPDFMRSHELRTGHFPAPADGSSDHIQIPDAIQPTHPPAHFHSEMGIHSDLSGSTSHELEALRHPLDVLDLQMADQKLRWTSSSSSRAEAAFEDPSIGWVTVRAHADGGGVHASVVPGSIEAAQALASHMSGLNSHIANQHPDVRPITLSAPDSGSSNRDLGGEMSHGYGGDNGQSNRQASPRDSESLIGSSAPVKLSSSNEEARSRVSPLPWISPASAGGHVSIVV